MKGRDLYNQLINFGDIDVSEQAVIGWIDMAQKKASLDVPVAQSVYAIGVVPGTTVPVSGGVFKLISAVSDSGEYPLTSVSVTPNSFTLHEAADFITITYTGPAPPFTSIDDELTIHPSLHAPLVYFLISMYYDMEGEGDSEESGLAERFYQRWVYYRNLAIAALMGTENDTFAREPVSTTDVLPKSSSRHLRGGNYYE